MISIHPFMTHYLGCLGGKSWLDLTKGTDCTEAFETYHVFEVSEAILKKFWVRKAATPRRYRFTFHKDGFYKTLQRRGAEILKKTGTGPDWSSSITQDLLTLSFLLSFALLCLYPTFTNAFLTGEPEIASTNQTDSIKSMFKEYSWACPTIAVTIGSILETSRLNGEDSTLTCPWWAAESGG